MSPDDSPPSTDAHGFAATNVVRVRSSRRGNCPHFYRVWMKPDDLAFPPHERRILGAEEARLRERYALRKLRGGDAGELRLDAGRVGRGMPQTRVRGAREGTPARKFANLTEISPLDPSAPEEAPPKNFETPLEISPQRFRWHCAHCDCIGWVNAVRDEGETDEQFRACVTTAAFEQHAHAEARCVSNELSVEEDRYEDAEGATIGVDGVANADAVIIPLEPQIMSAEAFALHDHIRREAGSMQDGMEGAQ